ncbi:hypothetical protein HR060_05475 [Catenovulum sp. SM1970]|uniref:hypothetical protein n=1 Tax=Marinifaba aquimaris TaxID=2741323 RepID=UPI0015732A01|nr:hypothetical protein [Marinifaba aquimaris]NTS76314.1 hypothetical protein [Marinifaba aquimaris]
MLRYSQTVELINRTSDIVLLDKYQEYAEDLAARGDPAAVWLLDAISARKEKVSSPQELANAVDILLDNMRVKMSQI